MKILYVNPPKIESGLDAITKSAPLSLITIAAMVPEHGAKVIDFKVDKIGKKQFRSELNRHDVVAITSMTPQIKGALKIAAMAKAQGCTTIMGGYHPTLAPEYVAQQPAVDYTVRGEGEYTFRELIDFIEGNKENRVLKEIAGVSYKNSDNVVVHNQDRRLECNLDNFPLPRRDLLRGKTYIHFGALSDGMETSRGCPYSCKFCCITKMWKDPDGKIQYRSKSIKRIMQELYDIDKKKDFVFFKDDNFTLNPKRTKKILETIIESGITRKFGLGCQSRVDTIYRNPWLVKLFAKARFRQIFLGIETFHQQSLDAMNKKTTTPVMSQKVVQMLQDHGISIHGGVIVGYPGETKSMVRQTICFVKSLKISLVQFTPITAFPGTLFYEEMKAKGMITSYNYRDYDLFRPMMRTEQLSAQEIDKLVKEAYAAYYMMGGDYLKQVAMRYLNPFSKFRWLLKRIPKVIKTFLIGGGMMLHEQGVSEDMISDELKNMTLKKIVAAKRMKQEIPQIAPPIVAI
ncbi:MAG: cobalamin B12-binding domain-containing protein [Candidatus Helarchaeota archaeon]|nr:cobalamin B12-binding domain-containing protein [Candidatus Helarchaeota archaeon]